MKCLYCGTENKNNNKFCINCGKELTSNINIKSTVKTVSIKNGKVSGSELNYNNGDVTTKIIGDNQKTNNNQDTKNIVNINELGLDNEFLTDNPIQVIENMIKEEIIKNKSTTRTMTNKLVKNKNILTLIYSIILLICFSLWFFHSHRFILISVLLIVTIIYFKILKKYNLINYLKKQVSARPDEKISYIVSSTLTDKASSSLILLRMCLLVLPFILVFVIFNKPRIIYEKYNDSYVVRFYTLGIMENDKTLNIPSTYKNKPVIGIRGDVFRDVYSIEKVVLPNTISEIRGGAFMNASNLKEINLPLGLKEIKGSTFEGCSSLREIVIPEGVRRIGGSAFRHCYNLEKAVIPKSVNEIGSSAFRDTRVGNVCVSKDAYINYRAFKDSTAIVSYYEDGCVKKEEEGYQYE